MVDNVNLDELVDVVNQLVQRCAMAMTKRDEMIEAAAKLLDQGGPAAVTLRAVGEAAGVSHNAPYKHFANKEELLAAVASRELDRQAKNLADISGKRAGTAARLRNMMCGYVRWAVAHPERFRLTFGRWNEGTEELANAASVATGNLAALVQKAQASGDLPQGDPERLSALLLALAHGAADRALGGHLSANGKGHADPEDLVDDLFRYLQRAARAAAR
jgi:AcrR family transcriptional regulator